MRNRRSFLIYLLYSFVLIITTVYSYSLVDLNLTLFNNRLWEMFRNWIIQIGYFQRDKSSLIYVGIVTALFLFNLKVVQLFHLHSEPPRQLARESKDLDGNHIPHPIKLAFFIGFINLFTYPFLSHDFFNYLFDAKIVTFYQQNPYVLKALDFTDDSWLRFMHWTHRTYPYGPVFLLITLIPSLLSFGKLVLNFLFFKLMFVFFYLLAVYFLNKMNKKWAIFFATHPLVIIEGLISPHNDLIVVSLAIVGIYYLFNKKSILGRLFLIFSAGIKYITLPLIILMKEKGHQLNFLAFCGLILVLIYLSLKSEIQPWYFLSLLAFLPFYERLISKLNIFFAGLLFSYYPYIRFGGWDQTWKIDLKHQIILIFFIINLTYFFFLLLKKDVRFHNS